MDVYGLAVFHKSWAKLEHVSTKYYRDSETQAPDAKKGAGTGTGKVARGGRGTSLDTRDWTWDAADWFHRSRPVAPAGLTREQLATAAAAAEVAAEAAAAGTASTGMLGGSSFTSSGSGAEAAKNGWRRRHQRRLHSVGPDANAATANAGAEAELIARRLLIDSKKRGSNALDKGGPGGGKGDAMERQCLRELHAHGLLSVVDASYDYSRGGQAEADATKFRYKSRASLPKHSTNGGRGGGGKRGGHG